MLKRRFSKTQTQASFLYKGAVKQARVTIACQILPDSTRMNRRTAIVFLLAFALLVLSTNTEAFNSVAGEVNGKRTIKVIFRSHLSSHSLRSFFETLNKVCPNIEWQFRNLVINACTNELSIFVTELS